MSRPPLPPPKLETLVVALTVLLTALAPMAVLAENQEDEAKELYRQAEEFVAAGQFSEAGDAFERAYELTGAADLAYNSARAYDKAEDWEDAARMYEKWLATGPSLQEREKLSNKLAEDGRSASASGSPELAVGRLNLALRLRTTPDPRLTYDVAVLQEKQGNFLVARELYRKALTEGFPDATELDTALGRVEAQLNRGRIILLGDEGDVRIYLDGKLVPDTDTGEEFFAPAGRHTITVVKEGFDDFEKVVEVSPGALTPVNFEMWQVARAVPKERGGLAGLRLTTWVGAGVAVAALGAGVLAGMRAADAEEELNLCRRDVECITGGQGAAAASEAGTYEVAANVSLGVGLAAAAFAVLAEVGVLDDLLGPIASFGPKEGAGPRIVALPAGPGGGLAAALKAGF